MCVFYYCRTYYKAVRVGGGGVCVYYCRTYYKAVRVGEEESGGHVL
jgi:hypothetical protein